MKGDFSRNTFRPAKHYSTVRMQQGRVQLDADWNEHVDLQQYLDQTTRRDVIGHSGTPQEPGTPAEQTGFALFTQGTRPFVRAGHYYVEGILCENEQAVALDAQPDLPGFTLPVANGRYLAFLDVWQRHVTALEDPELREVALGGPDSATRTRTVWQVRLLRLTGTNASGPIEGVPCHTFGTPEWLPEELTSTGTLAARGEPEQASDNPCIVAAEAGYRRLENQLYRVEVHRGNTGGGTATFKWSRDNGILFTQVESVDVLNRRMVVTEPGKDGYRRFQPNQWLELTTEERVLRGEPGELIRVEAMTGNRITIDAATWPATLPSGALTVRGWDNVGPAGALDIVPAPADPALGWTSLESGVQVRFTAGRYRTGDYWLIPARTVTRNVLWPQDGGLPVSEPAHGIRHHYCALAVLERNSDGWHVHDCRNLFPPLTEHKTLVYAGGDGQEVLPARPPAPPSRLARPLRAGVFNGRIPVVGARVQFSVVLSEGQGTVADVHLPDDAQTTIVVYTDASGIAEVFWTPAIDGWQTVNDPRHSQVVEARLLDHGNEAIHAPLRYFASLSVASKVAYDPDDAQEILNDTHTVQQALDTLSRQLVLTYEGGDGQEVLPGERLPHPLRVGVARHQRRAANQSVRFRVLSGAGGQYTGVRLAGSGNPWTESIVVTTGDDGLALVEWLPNPNDVTQQVEARLLVSEGGPLVEAHLPLVFTARLSLANRVAYQSGGCQTLLNADTVQEALDTLCRQRTFLYLGGDGQEGAPLQELPTPLMVAVMQGENPVANALVHFRILQVADGASLRPAEGTGTPGASLLVRTNTQGIAAALWTLSNAPTQRVSAQLVEDAQTPTRVPPILFNARSTVSVAAEPSVKVTRVEMATNAQLAIENDSVVEFEPFVTLAQGIRIICSEELAPLMSPAGAPLPLPRPVVSLSVEINYPLTTHDSTWWREQMGRLVGIVGHQTFELRGEARIFGSDIVWIPSLESYRWLGHLRNYDTEDRANPRLLVKLRIRGGYLHSRDGSRVLDGEVISRSLAQRFAAGLPNRGDGRQGGDFELWFWIRSFTFSPPGIAPGTLGPRTLIASSTVTSALEQPWGLARDAKRQELLVADTGANAVARLSLENHAAVGKLEEGLEQPTALVLDARRDELYVANAGGDSVAVFRHDDQGGLQPARVLAGKKTGLSGPLGLALDAEHQRLFVAGSGKGQATGLTAGPKGGRGAYLALFDAQAQGDTAPRARWTGEQLKLNRAAGLAWDAAHEELYVADYGSDAVAVYSLASLLDTKAAAVKPLRVLQGKTTGLSQPTGVSLDASGEELWVANARTNSITVYARDAAGNTAPLRTVEAPSESGKRLRAVLP
ncbi:DUF6519 domain-containing protein [Myxococcus faecalis]|uniref:DUF6519 domain-containing protein n=1 Tax=Myxococcus faecalis TaxID=3115646 RepID=UPI0038D1A5D2